LKLDCVDIKSGVIKEYYGPHLEKVVGSLKSMGFTTRPECDSLSCTKMLFDVSFSTLASIDVPILRYCSTICSQCSDDRSDFCCAVFNESRDRSLISSHSLPRPEVVKVESSNDPFVE